MPDTALSQSAPAVAQRRARVPVVVLPGDGIGPEVTEATRRVVDAAGAAIDWHKAEAGAACFAKGIAIGVPRETLDMIAKSGVVLKAPLETPVGFGGKSVNVTLRNLFEMFGNLRPVKEIPGIKTPFSGRGVDMIVVRENVEDLYAGIEHMQTPGVAQSLKLVTQKGCDRIVRLAFALARAERRRRVTVVTKANIMKLSEGLMKRRFEAIAKEFPDIQADHLIVDNCAHQMVIKPERLDVLVTTNLFGDILSDLAAGLVGGLGVAPSANIGERVSMFEPVHGSAPDIAGKGLANPTAMILAAAMMLRHVGQQAEAQVIERALFATLAGGNELTADLAGGRKPVSTLAFADAVIAAMEPVEPMIPGLVAGEAGGLCVPPVDLSPVVAAPKSRGVVGVDVFVEGPGPAAALGLQMEAAAGGTAFALKMIANRGAQVYPATMDLHDLVDHWRCRFVVKDGLVADNAAILELLRKVGLVRPWMHVEKLQQFDGADAFSKAQGEA
jgi:isocitrate dehydrogenase